MACPLIKTKFSENLRTEMRLYPFGMIVVLSAFFAMLR